MKKIFKENFIRYSLVSLVLIFLVFYIIMVILGFVSELRLLALLGGLFVISMGLRYLASQQKNRLLTFASTTLMLITFLDASIHFLDVIEVSFDSHLTVNIIFQSLGSLSILLLLYALFDDVVFTRKLMQIKGAAFDESEVIYFEFDRKSRLFTLECSNQFIKTYNLKQSVYVFDLNSMAKVVTFEDRIKLNELNHQNVKSIEKSIILLKLPEMSYSIQMTINGIYFHERKIIFITLDIDLLKNTLSLVSKLNKEKATMIDNLNVGIADHELIFVDGKPVDYRFNYINRAYEQLTGLTSESVTSHLASEIYGYTDLDLIDKYARIVKEDLREDFEYYYEKQRHWYQVTAYKTGPNRFLTAFSNITEMKQVAEEQKYMIYHDTLTGLLNEYGLTQALKNIQNVSRAICYFIDVRDFGSIVDFYGLDVSDAVIVEIAQYLKHYPHKDKLVSRYGGDLFVLLILNPNSEEDLRLNTYVKEIVFKDYAYQDILLQVRNQIGFAHYPEDVPHFDQLVSAASMASKKAALSQRNIIIKYHEDLRTTKAKELELAKSIKVAIDQNNMQVYFQKVIDNKNNSIYALEALARWVDPVLGYIPPDYFFRVAQEFNLIDYLEDYILEKAVHAFSEWVKKAEANETKLSLNVTPQVFLSHEQPEYINELCERYHVPSHRVIIEISENVFIHPMELIKQSIFEYKAFGFKIAIDDFGSEYSSLSILDQIDYDIIKIDGSFIKALHLEQNQEIVKMVVKVAKNLSKRVVAECVETKEDADFLSNISCYLHQGYFYHKPEKMI